MTEYNTKHIRDMRGKVSLETHLPLLKEVSRGIGDRIERAELRLRTYSPHPGKVSTYATVDWVRGNTRTHGVFSDYHKILITEQGQARISLIERQHNAAIAQYAEDIIKEVSTWYDKPTEA